jgi:hypothetical protein
VKIQAEIPSHDGIESQVRQFDFVSGSTSVMQLRTAPICMVTL